MILVTGSTGNVGRELIDLLRARGETVRASSRTPTTADLPADVEVVAVDLDDPTTLPPALAGVDRVFFLGYGDELPTQAANMAAAAKEAGVQHVVMLSSSSVDRKISSGIGALHLAGEQAFTAAGVPSTFLRPGPFHSNTFWWAPAIKGGETVVRHPFGNAPAAPIDPYDIAGVVVAVLGSEQHIGEAYSLTGGEQLTPAEQLRILSDIVGRPLQFEAMTLDEARAFMAGFYEEPNPEAIDELLEELLEDDLPWRDPRPEVATLTGRPPRTYREWAVAHADQFQPASG